MISLRPYLVHFGPIEVPAGLKLGDYDVRLSFANKASMAQHTAHSHQHGNIIVLMGTGRVQNLFNRAYRIGAL